MSPSAGYTPPFDYTHQQFSADLLHFCRTRANSPEEMSTYFRQKYAHPPEAQWKMKRLVAARAFLELHRGAFGRFYVESETGGDGRISNHLVDALGRLYTFAPDEFATPEVPLGIILQLAEEGEADGD